MSRTNLRCHFEEAFQKEGAELQICLKGSGPMGPGPVRFYSQDENAGDGVYEIVTLASDGRATIKYPVVFCIDDLSWFSKGPLKDDKPQIVVAPAGALHVGRGHG